MISLLLLTITLETTPIDVKPVYLCIKDKRYLHTNQGLFPVKGKCKPTDEHLDGWDRN